MKETPGTDTCTLASKTDLVILKTRVDGLDIDKLKTALTDLRKLSNVEDNNFGKKTVYDTLSVKINTINDNMTSTSGLLCIFQT